MKELLFGWISKKLCEMTMLNFIIMFIELVLFVVLIGFLIAFVNCTIIDIKFKKKMKQLKKKYDEE